MKGIWRRLSAYFVGSVRKQLIWGVALVHAVMMTLFVHDLTLRQHDFLIESQTDEAKNLAKTLSLTSISPMLSSDLAGLQELTAGISQYPGVAYAMVIHKTGKILAHGDREKRGLYVANMNDLVTGEATEPVVISRSRTLVDVVVPITANHDHLGWIRVGVGQSANSEKLASISTAGLLYTALAIAIGALLAWFMASRLTARLTNLRHVADSISEGKMAVRAAAPGTDELGHLARAFNLMLDTLALRAQNEMQLQHALQTEKELAQVTLASIGDAVITTDATGKVTFINKIAESFLGWPNSEACGRPVTEIFQVIDESTRQLARTPLHGLLPIQNAEAVATKPLLLSRNGHEFNIEDSAAPIYGHDGALLGCVLVFRDVTEKFRNQEKLQWQASHDALTGLPNRILLADRFDRALEKTRRNNNLLAVCVLDLDKFKPINDSYGHDVGDKLLIQVTERLAQELRGIDTLSRLGGDEFVILFEDIDELADLRGPFARILENLAAPFDITGQQITVSASIGVTIYPIDNSDADTLMRHADQAMYLAKQAGRNQVSWFDVHNDQHVQASHQVVSNVRKALERNELVLYYQPKVDMRSGEILGMEALLRWIHPEKGVVPPGEFLPHIEQSSLIVDIGDWVIETALQQALRWLAAGKQWSISVNIAARHLQMPNFIEQLKSAQQRYPDVPKRLLEIEILESVALNDVEQTSRLILEGQQLGIDFSLDDFGTGYSSLKYLKQLPVNTLKIDQGFVRDILEDKDDRAVVNAVIGLASAFNRKVIAEGVETWEHAQLLMQMGCYCGQGYGIARPMPAENVLEWANSFQLSKVSDTGN